MPAHTAIQSLSQKGRQHQLKLQLILSKAAALFNWQGTGATTLSDVAGSINLTKTCLYYYVENKQDLVYQCYVASCDMFLDTAREARRFKGSGLDKLGFLVACHLRQYAASLRDEAPHYAMLAEVSSLDQIHSEDIERRIKNIFLACRVMVEEGIADGSITKRDSSIVTQAIFSIIQWFPLWLNRAHAAEIDHVVEVVLDIILHGLFSELITLADEESSQRNICSNINLAGRLESLGKREAFYRMGSIFFNQKGYKGTSLDEIARALTVTKGAFYHHIKNKEELLHQCFMRTLEMESAALAVVDEAEYCGAKKLTQALWELVNVQLAPQGPLIRYRLLPSLDRKHRKQILKGSQKNANTLGDFIRLGVQDGTLRSRDSNIAQYILGGVIEAVPDLSEHFQSVQKMDVIKDYLSIFINGLSSKS